MTEKYTPQVGDRVTLADWDGAAHEVTAVGRHALLLEHNGKEIPYPLNFDWIKVDPLPELWCNVYQYRDGGGGYVHHYDAQPDGRLRGAFRVHLIPDGDGYRAEVIRP